jgi:integrase
MLQSIHDLGSGGEATQSAMQLLKHKVPSFDDLSTAQQSDLMIGAMRALIEQQRQFRFRLNERLLPYKPKDPLFITQIEELSRSPISSATKLEVPQKTGPRLGDLVQKYLEAKANRCRPKTLKMMAAKLGLLVDHVGQDTHISDVGVDEMRSFRDGVLRLRKSYRAESGTFLERQTDVTAGQISLKTASTTFKTVKSFWFWTVRESYLETSPVGNLEVDTKGYKKVKKARRPFAAGELETLFSAPLFLGCRSRFRRFEAGDLVLKDAKYWIPILGYYTGARLGELVQLHMEDVITEHKIPHISINEEYGSGHVKHLKSDAAVRSIPIHPDLIELGFLDFVEERRSKPRKDRRLFNEIKFGQDGQASTVFSKWFSQFMDKRGLADSGLVFHSFRHGVQDAYRGALAPQYLIDAIFGHQGTQTSDGYSHDIGLKAKLEAMSRAIWPIALPILLGASK